MDLKLGGLPFPGALSRSRTVSPPNMIFFYANWGRVTYQGATGSQPPSLLWGRAWRVEGLVLWVGEILACLREGFVLWVGEIWACLRLSQPFVHIFVHMGFRAVYLTWLPPMYSPRFCPCPAAFGWVLAQCCCRFFAKSCCRFLVKSCCHFLGKSCCRFLGDGQSKSGLHFDQFLVGSWATFGPVSWKKMAGRPKLATAGPFVIRTHFPSFVKI